jgi:hypothetical protein
MLAAGISVIVNKMLLPSHIMAHYMSSFLIRRPPSDVFSIITFDGLSNTMSLAKSFGITRVQEQFPDNQDRIICLVSLHPLLSANSFIVCSKEFM